MSLPRIGVRNQSNASNQVSSILQNWGQPGSQKQDKRLRRQGSQDDFGNMKSNKAHIDQSQDYQVSTNVTDSPRQVMKGDFRDEFNLDTRGPMRSMAQQRPMSNQLQQQNSSLLMGAGNPYTEISLPPSLSQDRMMKFNANVDGKALLHDLDQKFETQDRMINYLISQINSMETNMQQINRKAQSIADQERDARSKLETTVKYTNDQQHYNTNEVLQKINFLEESIKREEKTKMEMRDRLRIADENNRELMNFIKSIQTQSDTELTQMRTFLQEKLNDDHLGSIKQKEKSTVLFNEVVRLGQEYEKQLEYLQGLNSNYENRIQTMEARLAQTESSTVANERRGDIGQNMVSEIIEKLESKLLNVEQNLHFLKSEQNKERENLSRLEISSLRYNEDFKSVLSQVQNEFQGRLEIKMTDLVNRLLLEQEDRMRSLDDIRYQLDIKDKMLQEKSKHEREEMRDRYSAMDAVVRSEFQRKDEAIMALQNSLETQIRTINGWVKQEELARTQQEINLRTEIGKVADGVRYDVEGFKSQQVQVTEKLSEMIKMEVDSRLQSERENKQLIQGLIKNVMVEVAGIKEQSDKTLQKLMKDVKDTAHDSAERAHFLSRYIDEEIIKIGQKVTKQIDNIKTLCAKLTEQFKKHLINHENMKKDIYKRFEIIEGHLPIYRSELYKLLEGTEGRCLGKMKEVKDAIEQTMLTNFQVLDERVDQFSELVDSNMETLRKAIQDNREVFVSVINKTNEELEGRYNSFVEDLEKVVNEVYAMQVKVDGGDGKIKDESVKLNKAVNDLEAHINTSIITEKSVRKAQDHQLAEELDIINKKLQVVTEKMQIQIDAGGNQIEDQTTKLELEIKNTRRDVDKVATELTELLTDFQNMKVMSSREILNTASQLQVEVMTSKLESMDIYHKLDELFQNSSQTDAIIKEKLQKFMNENSGELKEEQKRKEQEKLNEVLDTKIQSAFEKLRTDNMYIWKESIKLAENEFNQKGVGETMNFLPKLLMDRSDLKRTVNSLILEDSTMPKALLKQNAPPQKPLDKKQEEEKKAPSLKTTPNNNGKATPNTNAAQDSKKTTPNQQQQPQQQNKQPTPPIDEDSFQGGSPPSSSQQQQQQNANNNNSSYKQSSFKPKDTNKPKQ